MTWLRGWAATALAYGLAGLAVVGGVLAVLAGQRARGRREAQAEQRDADQTAYIETRQEIDNAVADARNVPDRAEWLQQYNQRHGGAR